MDNSLPPGLKFIFTCACFYTASPYKKKKVFNYYFFKISFDFYSLNVRRKKALFFKKSCKSNI